MFGTGSYFYVKHKCVTLKENFEIHVIIALLVLIIAVLNQF